MMTYLIDVPVMTSFHVRRERAVKLTVLLLCSSATIIRTAVQKWKVLSDHRSSNLTHLASSLRTTLFELYEE